MKRTTFIILVLLIVAVASNAAATSPIRMYYQDREVVMDVPPDIKDGTTVIPVRVISESMGYAVNWDSATREVTVSGQEKEIKLRINDMTAVINGKPQHLLRPAEVINGRTMIPLRFVSEAMGAQVQWDGTKRQIHITQSSKPASKPLIDESGNPYIHFTLPPNLFK